MSQLSPCQENALTAILGFLSNAEEQCMVVTGYSGTGKSHLITEFVKRYREFQSILMLMDDRYKCLNLEITATTNKAADNLRQTLYASGNTDYEIRTVHSLFGLVPRNTYSGKYAFESSKMKVVKNSLIIIDEYSWLDALAWDAIRMHSNNNKIIFFGDPNQLVQTNPANVEKLNFREVEMTTIMRQLGNGGDHPIAAIGHKLRESVTSLNIPECELDNKHLIWLPEDQFCTSIKAEFGRENWQYTDSRILAMSNQAVVNYNNYVFHYNHARPHFLPGDKVVNNSYFCFSDDHIATDQIVTVVDQTPSTSMGCAGNQYTVKVGRKYIPMFVPDNFNDRRKLKDKFQYERDYTNVKFLERTWGDLRSLYASTVHKAQGSTFDKVYIDLTDLGKYSDKPLLTRLLYVAVTRAKEQVIFTGDIPS